MNTSPYSDDIITHSVDSLTQLITALVRSSPPLAVLDSIVPHTPPFEGSWLVLIAKGPTRRGSTRVLSMTGT